MIVAVIFGYLPIIGIYILTMLGLGHEEMGRFYLNYSIGGFTVVESIPLICFLRKQKAPLLPRCNHNDCMGQLEIPERMQFSITQSTWRRKAPTAPAPELPLNVVDLAEIIRAREQDWNRVLVAPWT
ncbi:hypothetical protein CRE_01401 [Caenorhabditis remanei]|uniref:Uncharacterized protein n=1 Tax=Caenorhabditis remanei TaxID=31234 RepID=E3NHV7_CAERE|nr:hypothetical protein CRE_01401 [Caenorhabditis remanei]